jgi:putative colanic acid biosynthesis acetyltransferase WcaF
VAETLGESGATGLRAKWYHLGEALYNNVITFVPSHNARTGALRLFGATIGRNCSFMRGTTVAGIESLVVGDDVVVAFRCVLDARGGLTIGSNVIISSDVHFVPGHHDINDPEFRGYVFPTVVEPYAWIAVRCTVIAPVHIGQGAVVSACSLVRDDIPDMGVVAGSPAKSIGTRTGELAYRTVYRPLFH